MEAKNCSECHQPVDDGDCVTTYRGAEAIRYQHRGCADQLEVIAFEKSGKLTTNLMMVAALSLARAGLHQHGVYDEVKDATDRLTLDVKRFETEAWFGGVATATRHSRFGSGKELIYPRFPGTLQSIIEDSPHRTLAARLGDVEITGQELAGRALIQFETKTARLTLITASNEQTPRMGIQGIDGTEDECRDMLNAVRAAWRTLKFKKARS
jgi:hypothetical protein